MELTSSAGLTRPSFCQLPLRQEEIAGITQEGKKRATCRSVPLAVLVQADASKTLLHNDDDGGSESLGSLNWHNHIHDLSSVQSMVDTLRGCRKQKSLEQAKLVYLNICNNGVECFPFLGDYLVPVLVDCGSAALAQQVFERLACRSEHSWTSLIQGHVELGEFQNAFCLSERMQEEEVSPTKYTLQALCKACARIKWIERGQELHSLIVKHGFDEDPFVSITLVDMYCKCGSLAEAQDVFKKQPIKDAVSWNALIQGYIELGLNAEALDCLDKMEWEGVSPDDVTYLGSLKVCGSLGAIEKGRELHSQVMREKLTENAFIVSALIDMYVKCGYLTEARAVLDKIPHADVVSWNAMLSGYTEHGLGEEVIDGLREMEVQGISMSAVTLMCGLKACAWLGILDRGQMFHNEAVKLGFERNSLLGSSLVDMYAKCGLLTEARIIFDELLVRDVVTWTALISGYIDNGFSEEALNCFEWMQLEGISPDAVTYFCSLKACGSLGAVGRSLKLHAEIAKEGFEGDPFVGSALVDMLAKCSWLTEAQDVFDEVPLRDVTMWNTLIAGYACHGESEAVFSMLEEMRRDKVEPDDITFLSVLTVCSHAGLMEEGRRSFEAMSMDCGTIGAIEHRTCMVDLLGRAGQLNEAGAMLERMPFQPSLITWNTVLGACQKWNDLELGKKAFECAVSADRKQGVSFVLMSNIYMEGDESLELTAL